jgi:putative lipoic acid-binding regulatory protein
MRRLDDERPEIEYPVAWTYRIICLEEQAVRVGVSGLLGDLQHTLVEVRISSAGRYRSLQLDVEVRDEAHRNEVFRALTGMPGVKMVI